MKTPKLKPRRMWANWYRGESGMFLHATKRKAKELSSGSAGIEAAHVAVIPLDDVEALVAKAHHAFMTSFGTADGMRAALVAIGVLPRAKKKGRK